MDRRSVLKFGMFTPFIVPKWSEITPSHQGAEFITVSKVKKVMLDGKDVTNRCYSFDQHQGFVGLYKRSTNGGFYVEHLDGTPKKEGEEKEYAWVEINGKKTMVHTNPTRIAKELCQGRVEIVEED